MTIKFERSFVEKIKAKGNKRVNLHFISGKGDRPFNSLIDEKGYEYNEMSFMNIKVDEIKEKIREAVLHHFKYVFKDDANFNASMIQDGNDVYFLLMNV